MILDIRFPWIFGDLIHHFHLFSCRPVVGYPLSPWVYSDSPFQPIGYWEVVILASWEKGSAKTNMLSGVLYIHTNDIVCHRHMYIHIYIYIYTFIVYIYVYLFYTSILPIPVVPGQAGGGSFQKEKNYIAQKEFAYRMCARRPTSAMPKSFLCCERAFCRSMVVMFCALK